MFEFRKKHRWILHLLFWSLYAILHFLAFGQFLTFQEIIIRLVLGGTLHAVLAYANYLYLVPHFFITKHYLKYFSVAILLVIIGVFLRMKVDELFPPITLILSKPESFSKLKIVIPIITFLTIWGLSSLFRLLEDHFENIKFSNELKSNQLETELKFLKTQINPHFLFNTLNNIYSMVYLKSDEAAPMVLKLSGILRYMLYESDAQKVPIQKEIDYLKDCIELQILNPADRPKVRFEIENHAPVLMIEPLLFINFLENSFKHGSLSKKDGFIHLKMTIKDNSIDFQLKNSILPSNSPKDKVGGIGLNNIKQRLELVYPNRHILEIKSDERTYNIHLVLKSI